MMQVRSRRGRARAHIRAKPWRTRIIGALAAMPLALIILIISTQTQGLERGENNSQIRHTGRRVVLTGESAANGRGLCDFLVALAR